jgi:hypothetical protein
LFPIKQTTSGALRPPCLNRNLRSSWLYSVQSYCHIRDEEVYVWRHVPLVHTVF